MYKSQFSDKKYVFCVCVDNLRPDRLGVNGNRIGHSDTIDRLLAEGINCVNCYSNSNPTQFSYPVIFSSTYALDYGGYSKGVMERPITLPEIFSNNSYATFGFSTSCFLENMSGYARGFDEFFILFDVAEHVWNRFVNVDLKYYHDLFSRNKITKELYLQKANELCVETFERMGSYFDDLLIKSEVYEKNYKKYDFLSANVAYLRELVDAEIVRMEEVGGRYFDQIHCYKNFYQFVSSVWGVELPFSIKVLLFLSGVSQKRIFSNKFVKLLFQVKNIRFVSADKIVKHVSDIVNAKKGKNLFSGCICWMCMMRSTPRMPYRLPFHDGG